MRTEQKAWELALYLWRRCRLSYRASNPGDLRDIDALIGQRFGLFLRALAVNPTRFRLAMMDPPCFIGKFVAYIVAMRLHLGAQFLQRRAYRIRDHAACGRLRRGRVSRLRPPARYLAAALPRDARRHQRAGNFRIRADRADDQAVLGLAFKPRAVAKPAIELVGRVAMQLIVDHMPAMHPVYRRGPVPSYRHNRRSAYHRRRSAVPWFFHPNALSPRPAQPSRPARRFPETQRPFSAAG